LNGNIWVNLRKDYDLFRSSQIFCSTSFIFTNSHIHPHPHSCLLFLILIFIHILIHACFSLFFLCSFTISYPYLPSFLSLPFPPHLSHSKLRCIWNIVLLAARVSCTLYSIHTDGKTGLYNKCLITFLYKLKWSKRKARV